MNRDRYLRIYDLHSWSGICLGLFIYIVAFTGCLALFVEEIKTWEAPELRHSISDEVAPIMPQFRDWVVGNAQGNKIDFITFYFPSSHEPYYRSIMGTRPDSKDAEQSRSEAKWLATTGEQIEVRGSGLSTWLLDFHRELMWPDFIGGSRAGRSIVGIAGIVLMLSIISGIITHTKIIKQMFTLRVERSNLLKWQDMHKVLGLWPLPFHVVISFTGASLGIIALLSPLVAAIAFKGDTEALTQAVNAPRVKPTGIHADMLSVDQVWDTPFRIGEVSSDELTRPKVIVINNWGDKTARYNVLYPVDTELAFYDRLILDATDGKVIKREAADQVSPAFRVTNAITPLHYGNFGGIWLKALYAGLGLMLAVLTATGLIIWIERRLYGKEGRKNPNLYQRIDKLTIGVTLGLPVASVAIFYLDKLYFGAESARLFATGITYFFVWLGCIAFAFLRKNKYACINELFLVTAIMLVFVPLLNFLTVGDNLFFALGQTASWAWVDMSIAILGCFLAVVTLYLPKKRRLNPREKHVAGYSTQA